MLTKKITYTDYDGNERTETFYFNLTKTELAIMNNSAEGGLNAKLQKMVDGKRVPDIMSTFCEIIRKAYGEKSDDGRRLMKSEERSKAFEETPAYDQLFLELTQNEDAMVAFIKGVLPSDLAEQVNIPSSTPVIKEVK